MVIGQIKPVFKIQSCDGQVFAVEDWFIQKSKCFSVVLAQMNNLVQPHPLKTSICSFVLVKIIEWCYHHRNEDQDHAQRILTAWDVQFIRTNSAILLHLAEAAFRLEIVGLLDVACRAVSIMLGRTLNEVKLMLRVGGVESPSDEEDSLEDVLELEVDVDENEEDDVEIEIPAISAA
ncbi:SKP1 component POZ domain-containing protein [Caenorhabditis elegans]|uniref:SKP1 component POZ domain-containing protein n=2 Tax=Caenorhabditis elegans TaxID=6239 RepID=Q21367_CAEEL|nr:SKP1 component POZ domain-containing protein [Caenorhabditis elegans]CAA94149.1 SKP1 component POZ domain-containing protein [Caenorhabditis elegans]|eukprot:NP_510194.1 SKp1 Related (ubiquitin ligase complex component) [Caenorhabditis elegans]